MNNIKNAPDGQEDFNLTPEQLKQVRKNAMRHILPNILMLGGIILSFLVSLALMLLF